MTEPNLDQIRETLTCLICQDLVTLPVHSMCCEQAAQMNPGCLSCVRSYYELNKRPIDRAEHKKSWGGCGCDMYPSSARSASRFYTHTRQLDMMRNLFGPSKCPNEDCIVACKTTAELRRHLNGQVNSCDKNPACQKAMCKCEYCGFFGKREIVNGEHYLHNHSNIYCRICDRQVPYKDAQYHYNYHAKHLTDFQKDFDRVKANICSRSNAVTTSSTA